MLSVFIYIERDKLKILAVTSPLETCRLTDARVYMGFTPNTPQATASTECGRLPGWQRQGHITPLKPLLTPSLLQSGMSKEKEVNLLEISFPAFVSTPAREVKLNSRNAPSSPAGIFS